MGICDWKKAGEKENLYWAGKFLRPKKDFNVIGDKRWFLKKSIYYCIAERTVDYGWYDGWGTGLQLLGPDELVYFDDENPGSYFDIVTDPKNEKVEQC
jgi:hypothetical protein